MPNVMAQLTISLVDNGQVTVEGPIENQLFAFGMLEMAKVAINNAKAESEKRVALAPPGSAQFLAANASKLGGR